MEKVQLLLNAQPTVLKKGDVIRSVIRDKKVNIFILRTDGNPHEFLGSDQNLPEIYLNGKHLSPVACIKADDWPDDLKGKLQEILGAKKLRLVRTNAPLWQIEGQFYEVKGKK